MHMIDAVVSVSQNAAVPKLMGKEFGTVLPDLRSANPLHALQDEKVQEVIREYGEHIGAKPDELPFVRRYIGGLYGDENPSRRMPELPQLEDPEYGIVVVAMNPPRGI